MELHMEPLLSEEIGCNLTSVEWVNVKKDTMEAVKVKAPLSCEVKWWGRIMKGPLRKAEGVTEQVPGSLTPLCKAIMMHEGPLHVYDMIVSDLLAPHGN